MTTRAVNVFTLKLEPIDPNDTGSYPPTHLVRNFSYSGVFHGFSHESDSDGSSLVVAIVEKPDGTVDTPSVSCIQFVSPSIPIQ